MLSNLLEKMNEKKKMKTKYLQVAKTKKKKKNMKLHIDHCFGRETSVFFCSPKKQHRKKSIRREEKAEQ